MAVATTGNKIFRYGDDNNTVWPFPYPVPEARDIKVIITPPGGDDQYISPNLFQVDGAGTDAITVTYPLSGEPLPMGWKITILRELELLSDFDPDNGAGLNAEEVTFELDRHVMMIQQQQEQLGRAMVLPASEETDFVRMIETVVTESRQVEEYYNLIKETAGTFDSATETQRGVGYAATADEAENFTTEARDPTGPAFLTPETGKILVDTVTAGIGLGTAAIDRLGTVRIAKQSEVTSGVTETGRSPAVLRPEEHVAAHATVKVFYESGEYTTARKCLIRATVIDGGQGGGRGGGDNTVSASNGRGGTPGHYVVTTFFCDGGITIPISVGAGGAGAGFGNQEKLPTANGAWGGFSSVGDGIASPVIRTFAGDNGNTYGTFTVPGNVSRNTAGNSTGTPGIAFFSPVLAPGKPGAGGTSSTTNIFINIGGNGGSAGWIPPITGLVIPSSLPAAQTNAEGYTANSGGVSTGFGAGGPGAGVIARNGRAYSFGGGTGAPGLVILEIF